MSAAAAASAAVPVTKVRRVGCAEDIEAAPVQERGARGLDKTSVVILAAMYALCKGSAGISQLHELEIHGSIS
ncbi:hypothetical protein GCM10010329_45440 [Streptomyces spiroverticillatus]|uniref:Uncharacterized protein n=1 Tax=Streptomyces finlayi TaxID=67296 RepID=A0A918WZR0_9ACTN|nr:hypothetical protein GCM10010329_45440 [Streptomyces spiroverticillatus]GHC99255.1 hypothetical protein GCM10010334_42610 [Streptomyces finlayi]